MNFFFQSFVNIEDNGTNGAVVNDINEFEDEILFVQIRKRPAVSRTKLVDLTSVVFQERAGELIECVSDFIILFTIMDIFCFEFFHGQI